MLNKRAAYKESKPKRAMSAYMFFVKDNRMRICQENPDLKFADIGKLLGQAWRDCPNKHIYEDMAAKDKIRAQKQKEKGGNVSI